MKDVAACGFVVILLDAVLSLALWAELVLLECPGCGGLPGVWAFGAAKWAALRLFASRLSDGNPQPVLCRLIALLCLLLPVFESGRILMTTPSAPYVGPPPDLSMLLLVPMSSVLACVVWEKGLFDDGKKRKDAKKLDAGRLLMRMVKYYKPDALYLAAAFGFLILGVICDTFIPFYQGEVIDMLKGQVLHTSFFYAVGHLALVSVGSALFSGLRGGIFMCTLARLNRRLKHLLFHTLMQQDVHFFEENKAGSLSSRLHSDVDKMGRTVALIANVAVRSSVKTCLMLIVMIRLSWELTLLICIEMPLLTIIQNKFITLYQELKDQLQDCEAQKNDLALQTVRNIRTVRNCKTEADELKRYEEILERVGAIKRRREIYSVVSRLLRVMISLGIKILMLIQARSLISSGRLSIGTLVSFFLYQRPMTVNLKELLYCYGETVSTVGVISKVFSYIDRTPKCRKAGELAPEKLRGKIVFQDVTFTYPSASEAVLKSVSMEMQPGKMTALVGLSGSGKTSCVSLLKRLYEPQQGQILLDGEPLHHYQHQYFHQKVALVSQNPVLFSGSLRYNIEYGLKNCGDEKVKEAATKVKADDFISELEDEYDTDVGGCGSELSEGLQQHVAIIRALVRDPQVILLDEATSKLDVVAQHAIMEEILSCQRTVVVVTHQPKTVEKADHIVVIKDGAVAEQGTHQELMANHGPYHTLFCSQAERSSALSEPHV